MRDRAINASHVPGAVEIFYGADQPLDEIDLAHKEFCLVLLQDLGFRCTAGAAASESSTVNMMAREAMQDVVSIANSAVPNEFFPGPHPYLDNPNAVGIWTRD